MGVTGGLYSLLLLSGLLGSVGHCLGMCGPLVLMVGLQARSGRPRPWAWLLLYHSGRVTVYALLGAALGALGSLIGLAEGLSGVAGLLSLGLGLALVALGLSSLGWRPLSGRARRPLAAVAGPTAHLSAAMAWALRRGGAGAFVLGACAGLLPCPLAYSALLAAAASAHPLASALGMALFGAGTVPVLLIAGMGAHALGGRERRAFGRAAGALFGLVGGQLALRGLAGLHLVPHLQVGRVMLW